MSGWGTSLVAVSALAFAGCGGSPHSVDEKYFLISTNIKVPYWQEALAGVNRAAAQLQVRAEMVGPDTYDPKAQHEQFQETLKQKPTGILLSASDPTALQDDIAAAVAQGVPVITIDSDAPTSKRLLFIGTDNYKAGVMGARVVASRLEGKGSVVIYTMPEQPNLKDRMRGYMDVFHDHPQIKVVEVVDVKGDPRVAYDKTTEMIEKNAKVDAFVCLEANSGPEIADVLDRKKVTGKLVVAMDADERTLEGIRRGSIAATVGQRPFTMAFLGIKALDDLHHHPLPSLTANWAQEILSPIPAFVDTGTMLIDKSNVDAFAQSRKAATSGK